MVNLPKRLKRIQHGAVSASRCANSPVKSTFTTEQEISIKAMNLPPGRVRPQRFEVLTTDIQAELRARLYENDNHITIKYADLVAHCSSQRSALDATKCDAIGIQSMDRSSHLPLVIDVSAQTNAKRKPKSLDLLPYILFYSGHRHVDLLLITSNKPVGLKLISFTSDCLQLNADDWARAMESDCLKEVRIWWVAKRVDIVLKPLSTWARDWDCSTGKDEDVQAQKLKRGLGVAGTKLGFWRGAVAVGSVEQEDL